MIYLANTTLYLIYQNQMCQFSAVFDANKIVKIINLELVTNHWKNASLFEGMFNERTLIKRLRYAYRIMLEDDGVWVFHHGLNRLYSSSIRNNSLLLNYKLYAPYTIVVEPVTFKGYLFFRSKQSRDAMTVYDVKQIYEREKEMFRNGLLFDNTKTLGTRLPFSF